jgi:hypothetical protein
MAITVIESSLNAGEIAAAGVVDASSSAAGISADAGPRDGAIVLGLPGWTTPPAWWTP